MWARSTIDHVLWTTRLRPPPAPLPYIIPIRPSVTALVVGSKARHRKESRTAPQHGRSGLKISHSVVFRVEGPKCARRGEASASSVVHSGPAKEPGL